MKFSAESRQAEGPSDQRFSPASITLPKGGGAIKGIGEKFAANPVTGTGSMTIPLPLSAGRSGFTPGLSLSYDSGAGNGPYGFGWSLAYPAITRRTDRGLPQYLDYRESDVYILSGSEDLVPVLNTDGSRFEEHRDGYRVTRYRPRIEGPFARIERWAHDTNAGDIFWRSISRDNVTTFFGRTTASRIADPADPTRIFTWLLSESFDDKGNAAVYEYIPEDGRNVDTALPSESNRRESNRSANRYLKRVKYGNKVPQPLQPDLTAMEWLFELVMDYGDHAPENPTPDPARSWPVRPDPFSTHRSGFEVRTYRRCWRVLMFHRFLELGPQPRLVRSLALDFDDFSYPQGFDTRTELEYAGSSRISSLLRRVTVTSYGDQGQAKSMPPLELTYSRPHVSEDPRMLEEGSYANLPSGVDGVRYQWLDLNSEGIAGVLSEHDGAWWYKPNLGEGKLGSQQLVAQKPTTGMEARAQFLDLAGDGLLDLVQLSQPNAGFFERTEENGWTEFRPFMKQLNIEWADPNLRFIDLTGDGHADVLITEDDAIVWHPALAEDGFGERQSQTMASDESLGPKLVFADTTETVFLADMSGDGLTDLVRIRNGEVCYWPNQGYGRFGAKVTMDNAPVFDAPELFEPRRTRLGDIDGSGVVDIIYLAGDGVRLYFNQSGNGWTAAYKLANFPPIDNIGSVSVTDLLGNGTACLVWSSPLPNQSQTPLYFLDLMGGEKPHLLIGAENNLGARTVVQYASSTRFYLEDQLAGRPWITRLPFSVYVVERTETFDDISRNRFVRRYTYHHGYFDGVEREFRGFGMVEQFDTEEYAALNETQNLSAATNIDAASHVPPIMTRTWFHTGNYFDGNRVSNFFAGMTDDQDPGENYREPGSDDAQAAKLLLPDTILPDGLSRDEAREACRSLKGAMLRQEIYALDRTGRQSHPYTVTEQNFTIRVVQPMAANPHAVFLTHPREVIGYHYERNPADPRIAHSLTLEVDAFGNVLKSAAVTYGRRLPEPTLETRDQVKQTELHITYSENTFTDRVEASDSYRAPLPCESRNYELTGLTLTPGSLRFALADLLTAGSNSATIAYEQTPSAGAVQKRLIEHVRTLFRSDDLLTTLPLGQMQALALPFEAYKLSSTPGLVSGAFGSRVNDSMLVDDGRYVHSEGDNQWWIPSGRVFYSPGISDDFVTERAFAQQHFFLPLRFQDPFGQTTTISLEHDLLALESRDALGNTVTVGERTSDGIQSGNDYRVLQPRLVTDPNGNRTAVAFDAMGMVVGTAIMGKRDEVPRRGDLLDGFEPDLSDEVAAAHLANPLADPHSILAHATTRLIYDLFAYSRSKLLPQPRPAVVYTMVRETHDADLAPGQLTKIQHSFSYSDGFGRELQRKIQAEPGPVPQRDANGDIVVGTDGQPQMTPGSAPSRWVGSGWTIFNNKGKPVREFEPFFTDTPRFERDVRVGVSPVLFYDPATRVVATLHPDHTWEKVVFDPWRQESWDVSDTALIADPKTDADVGDFFRRLPDSDYLPTWHAKRQSGGLGAQGQIAAAKTAIHAATPSVAHADSLGRTFLTIAHNKYQRSNESSPTEEFFTTRVAFDIEGNQREVVDANDRVVMRYDYNMLGQQIHQASMEAGERWALLDVVGKPIYAWDSRDHTFRTKYDELHRPTDSLLSEGSAPARLIGHTVYGESRSTPEAKNQRGKAVQLFDQTGVVTSEDYDFKGNLLATHRQFAQEYKATLDWSGDVPLEPSDVFTSSSSFDALNRPTQQIAPDGSRIRHSFSEANLLQRVEANVRGDAAVTTLVSNIDHDSKGRRTLIEYGNDTQTTYTYDRETFRLTNLSTTRLGFPTGQQVVQDLSYAYDPGGNITHIQDDADIQNVVFFRNRRVEPSNDYIYDAVYRLIEASGREHLGLNGGGQILPPTTSSYNDVPRVGLLHPGDGNVVGTYTERYNYDPVGNFLQFIHRVTDPANPGWTRSYAYNETSLLESEKVSNRLTLTQVSANQPLNEEYLHDTHGNMTTMPQLRAMQWDFRDQLSMTQRQAVNTADEDGTLHKGERTYYVYDASGQRSRKVTESSASIRRKERFYLGGFEVHREYGGGSVSMEHESLHIMDDKQRVALIETRTHGTETDVPPQLTRYQFSNHLGSASLELDEQAQIISYEEYCPYGNTSYQAGRSAAEVTLKRYRYTGMERDEESGLNYHAARYFASWLGRWTEPDPTNISDGPNLYRYVSARPLKQIDRNGANGDDMVDTSSKIKVKVWGAGSLGDAPVTTSTGQNAGHVTVGQLPVVKFNVTKGQLEVTLITIVGVEVDPPITSNVSLVVSAKVGAATAKVSKKGVAIDVTAFQAGIGAKVGPVKGQALVGVGVGGSIEDGKIKFKAIAGVGGEIEIDAGAIYRGVRAALRPVIGQELIQTPVPPLLAKPEIEEVGMRWSSVAHVESPPPVPKKSVAHHHAAASRKPMVKYSEAYRYLGYPCTKCS
jgi:RHS repeat-associated protein